MISHSDLLTLTTPLIRHALLPTRTLNLATRSDDDYDDDNGPSNLNCVTAVPGQYGQVPPDACNSYYNAPPEYAPAVAIAVIFGLLTLSHVVQAALYRKPYAWVVIMGGLWETIAFVMHALGAHDMQNQGFATGWMILFLLAPLWINAFVYMTMARMVLLYSPTQSVGKLRAERMTMLFVLADILLFLVQGAGGSMTSPGSDANTVKTGLNIYMAGTAVQQLFIVMFIVVMIMFHRNMIKLESVQGSSKWRGDAETATDVQVKKNWRPLLYAMYATLLLITVRICFRIAEFAPGLDTNNVLIYKEIYPYMLDVLPMTIALLILAVIHPGRTLIGPGSEFPKKTRAQKKEVKARRKALKNGGSMGPSVMPGNIEMSHGVAEGYSSTDHSQAEGVEPVRHERQFGRPV